MAVDKTEPPIKVILSVAGLSISILVALRVFFVSYFNNAYETRAHEHVEVMLHGGSYFATAGRVRPEEERRLDRLQAAMSSVAQGQRAAAIAPAPSTDIAALQGWTLIPHEVPRRPPPPAPVAEPTPATPAMAPGNVGGPATLAPMPARVAAPVPAAPAAHPPVRPPPVAPRGAVAPR